MDSSVEGVTLYAGFVFDVLEEYKGLERLCAPAFALASHLDPRAPMVRVPMATYNEICSWIETHVGAASVRRAGRAIGDRVFDQMRRERQVPQAPTPGDLMRALKLMADTMIQDPKGRGWELRRENDRSVLMRRTQTFNCILQEGLLLALTERSGVLMPSVRQVSCTRAGADYCDYLISWLPPSQRP